MMNFAISRREFVHLAKIGKTKSFDLQKSGKLIPLNDAPGPRFFELGQALVCIANIRGLPPPSKTCVETNARMILDLRVKATIAKQAKKS